MSKQLNALTEDTSPDADAYLVLDKSTYGEAVKVTYTVLLQALPVALQTSGGNTRGTAAVDLQVTRVGVTYVASGNYSVMLGGASNTASGAHAVIAGGYGNLTSGAYTAACGGLNTVSGAYAAAIGIWAKADKHGQLAHAADYFAAVGDAQCSVYLLRNATTDDTPTVLYPDGSGTAKLTIADDTVWNFRAEVAAVSADADEYAAYTVVGLVKRANGTVAVAGVATTTLSESDAGMDATAEADDTGKALNIKITGKAGTPMRWVCAVYTTEVTFAG